MSKITQKIKEYNSHNKNKILSLRKENNQRATAYRFGCEIGKNKK